MQLLKELNINGLSFDLSDIYDRYIILRIKNESDRVYTSLSDSQYFSRIRGVVQLEHVKPFSKFEDIEVPKNFFIDVKISFGNNKFENGERIKLLLRNIAYIIIEYQSGEWYVVEWENNQILGEYLTSKCIRFESIEEKLGITIQNISINVIAEYSEITPCCEVTGSPSYDILIKVVIYDKFNKIIDTVSKEILKSKFMGYEVLLFSRFSRICIPLSDIGKIYFLPQKR